ncbi:MAG: 2-oxoglutarate synthase, partial [Proteobacteria bacterium]
MEAHTHQTVPGVSIAIIGSGGAGVMTAGSLLLEAAGKAGYYGIMTRSSGPQIRGGEAAAMLRLSTVPVESHDDTFDLLLAIDWLNAERFSTEIPLGPHSALIGESGAQPPREFLEHGARAIELPLKALAREIDGGRENMVALGIVAALVGLSLEPFRDVLSVTLARKGQSAVESSMSCLEAGAAAVSADEFDFGMPPPTAPRELWNMSGNEAAGLGAIRGGVRFVAAYP